jgi:hypothetical protein
MGHNGNSDDPDDRDAPATEDKKPPEPELTKDVPPPTPAKPDPSRRRPWTDTIIRKEGSDADNTTATANGRDDQESGLSDDRRRRGEG